MKKLFVLALLVLGAAMTAQAAEDVLFEEMPTSVYLSTAASPAALAITGAGLVYGVQCSSGAVTNYLVLSATNTLNVTTEGLMPRFMLITSAPQAFTFPKPIRISDGMVARMAATTLDAGCSVFYRKTRME